MEPLNRLTAKLDRVAEKINRASFGYSGFFDSIKIEENELNNMLAYDTQLMNSVRKIGELTANFKAELNQGRLENARTEEQLLDDSISSLESAFDQRKMVIEGVKV